MNFILIFCDGWRADFANNPKYTPHLHKFLEKYGGYKFLNAYSTTIWTWPAILSMFTGLLPIHHGLDDITFCKHEALQAKEPDCIKARNCTKDDFLMTKLKKRGYTTKAFEDRIGEKYLRGTGQVFYDKMTVCRWNRFQLLGMTKEPIEEPFFYFVRTIDTAHAPWGRFPRDSREAWKKALTTGQFPSEADARANRVKWNQSKLTELLADQSIQWDEEQVAKLLQWFVNSELYKNTAIFFVSDHGISLGERGTPVGHGLGCQEEIVHVPLYVYWPEGDSKFEVIDDLVSVVDIVPTILGEDHTGDGVNLFKRKKDRAVFFEFKRQRNVEGVEKEFKELPSYDVFIRGVRWGAYRLTYSRNLKGMVKIELSGYGKEENRSKCFKEGFEKLCSVYSDFDVPKGEKKCE